MVSRMVNGLDARWRIQVQEPAMTTEIDAIVLEDLDFLVDCVGQRLVPRDPDRVMSEIE